MNDEWKNKLREENSKIANQNSFVNLCSLYDKNILKFQ